jgi:hypothetical protein
MGFSLCERVILGSSDIGMVERSGRRWDGRERGAVQAVFEDGFDALIGARTDGEGTAAGGFEPFRTIAFAQPHDA